jgi:RNA ligase
MLPSVVATQGEPEIYEKMDGFLCILYNYNGQDYIASKGSFNSVHAKWATKWYQKHVSELKWHHEWPKGYTPVFEGITPNLRIVVDYGKREELTLLALVNKETGEELYDESLKTWAVRNTFFVPDQFILGMQKALEGANTDRSNFEGYVLVWRRPGQTPFRLKVKYLTYLKLHRMVTQVSPKRILEALASGWPQELNEWLNESNPWFSHFISKWKNYLENEYKQIYDAAMTAYAHSLDKVGDWDNHANLSQIRKAFASIATNEQNKPISGVLFAMLDGKDVRPIIWKMLKSKVSGVKPLVDSHL